MYYFVFVLLVLGTVIEFLQRKTPKKLYVFSVIVLTLMLCLRYGQGTDYFGYYYLYNHIPSGADIGSIITLDGLHGETGWKLICSLFKTVGLNYQWYLFIWSLVEMILFIRFVERFCPMKISALLLSYHTIYLTYFFSAQRQGFVIAFFLGVLLVDLVKKRWKQYLLGVLLCATIHSAALVLIVLPLAFKIRWTSLLNQLMLIFACWIIGLLIYFAGYGPRIAALLPGVNFLGVGSVSFVAVMERLATFVVVMYATSFYFKHNATEDMSRMLNLVKVYTWGMMIYGAVLWAPGLASRIMSFFKVVEIAIVSMVITDKGKAREILISYCLIVSSALFFKNIDSYIAQGLYHDDITATNYPYISIFDKEEIYKCRDIRYNISEFVEK